MQRSLSARIEALEALEAAQAPETVLCAFLQIRPADYAALLGDDDDAAAQVFVAYGLDQLPDGARVNVWGGTWPCPLRPNELTVYHQQDAAGWGLRIDRWPLYPDAPAPDSWRWCVAQGDRRYDDEATA